MCIGMNVCTYSYLSVCMYVCMHTSSVISGWLAKGMITGINWHIPRRDFSLREIDMKHFRAGKWAANAMYCHQRASSGHPE